VRKSTTFLSSRKEFILSTLSLLNSNLFEVTDQFSAKKSCFPLLALIPTLPHLVTQKDHENMPEHIFVARNLRFLVDTPKPII
jgi:hypothetical protein